MLNIIRSYNGNNDLTIENEILSGIGNLSEIYCITEDELIENCQEADALICGYQPFTKRVLDNLPNLKLIAFKSIGYNTADIDYAKEKGITVTNIRNYCTIEVADHTLALIMAINRRIPHYNKSIHQDKEWKYNLYKDIERLDNQNIGLLGFGNIPKILRKRLSGFDSKIYVYDPFLSKEVEEEYNVKLVDLATLFEKSDYISCHLPLNEDTKYLLNKEAFDSMKDGVNIINTGRGGIINEADLLEALNSGKVNMAALDVLENEQNVFASELIGRDDVILTPHVGFYSNSSMINGRIEVAENILNFFEGNLDKCNIVNP